MTTIWFGIWIEEESDFEKGLSENDVTVVESHPILNQITSYLETYFKGQDQDLSELPLAPVGTSDFRKKSLELLAGNFFWSDSYLWANS